MYVHSVVRENYADYVKALDLNYILNPYETYEPDKNNSDTHTTTYGIVMSLCKVEL